MMLKEKEAVNDGLSNNSKYAEEQIEDSNQLKRKLNARHLRMIAIGGTIGTGLFIASGSSIATAGPVGSLLAYGFVGTMVYSVMNSLGEMGTYIPISGAFTAYATRFVHPSLGYAMGWINWFQWAVTYALQLTATGLIIQYWAPHLDIGIFIGVFWVLLTTLNFFPVSIFGEFEFWLSLIKIITVIGFVIFAICIDAGAGKNGYLGFSTWKNPGAFAPYIFTSSPALGKFVGFWSALITAGFSFQGVELVGIAAGECENPRKNVPEAIRKTFIQVLVCFMVSIFFVGLLVPSNSKYLLSGASDASASPFVIAAKLAGVKVLPEIINGILFFVIISASISSLYSGSRMLMGLAANGSAPSIFKRTDSRGVPYIAVAATSMVGLLGFLNESERGGEVFEWLVNIISIGGFITWVCISLCHIAFIRALATRGIPRETLPFCAVGGKWFAWYGLLFNVLIILTQGFKSFLPWDVTKFITNYITLFLFVILFVGHCLLTKSQFVNASEADIATGCISCLPETWENKKPRKMWERVIGYII